MIKKMLYRKFIEHHFPTPQSLLDSAIEKEVLIEEIAQLRAVIDSLNAELARTKIELNKEKMRVQDVKSLQRRIADREKIIYPLLLALYARFA